MVTNAPAMKSTTLKGSQFSYSSAENVCASVAIVYMYFSHSYNTSIPVQIVNFFEDNIIYVLRTASATQHVNLL